MSPTAIFFTVGRTVTRADVPVLCAELAEILRESAGDIVVCEVAGAHEPDLVTVEALARLSMTARRHGRRLVVAGGGPGLSELMGLLGLADALPQVGGEFEQGEEPGGVEEVVDGRDPSG